MDACLSPQTGQTPPPVEPFAGKLQRLGLTLARGVAQTLQINVGPRCNLLCKHCHLEAGPHRQEQMSRQTMEQVVAYCRRGAFQVADVTGGAAELHPELLFLLDNLAPLVKTLMLRTNLVLLATGEYEQLLRRCVALRVVLVASLPALQAGQVEAQRGPGVWEQSLSALRLLNALGYGQEKGLELDLVSNPTGAFLPPGQAQAEKRFKQDLLRKHTVRFNQLFTFANAPLGRFKAWLLRSGNYEGYLRSLAASFNPCTLDGLMCRSLVSVGWDGMLYDCDFNLGAGIPLGGRSTELADQETPPAPGAPIAVADHCYCCTAGAGFT
jgi:radical SAM/Cys-rich protein